MDAKQFASAVTAGLTKASIGPKGVFSIDGVEVFPATQPDDETVARVMEGRTPITIVQTSRDIMVKQRINGSNPQDVQAGPTYVESGYHDARDFLEQAWDRIQATP